MRYIAGLLFLIALMFLGNFNVNAELYSAGPWRGRVLDADTKEPIEGAVVVAIWEREYESQLGSYSYFHDAKEVLTDKEGKYEIPTYVEKKDKSFWRNQDLKEEIRGPSGWYTGPRIRDPIFIIYKPWYGNFPHYVELGVYAIGPGPSKVEYQEFHKEISKGQEITWDRKGAKTFREGLVYYGKRCQSKMNILQKSVPFSIGSFFMTLENAEEKLETLKIPLDCPQNAEPIPSSMRGYRRDIINPLISGGYIIIQLSKLRTPEERRRAIPSAPSDVSKDKIPLFYKLINE